MCLTTSLISLRSPLHSGTSFSLSKDKDVGGQAVTGGSGKLLLLPLWSKLVNDPRPGSNLLSSFITATNLAFCHQQWVVTWNVLCQSSASVLLSTLIYLSNYHLLITLSLEVKVVSSPVFLKTRWRTSRALGPMTALTPYISMPTVWFVLSLSNPSCRSTKAQQVWVVILSSCRMGLTTPLWLVRAADRFGYVSWVNMGFMECLASGDMARFKGDLFQSRLRLEPWMNFFVARRRLFSVAGAACGTAGLTQAPWWCWSRTAWRIYCDSWQPYWVEELLSHNPRVYLASLRPRSRLNGR